MRKLRYIFFIVLVSAILAIPVIILANTTNQDIGVEETIVIGTDIIKVRKEKTREELVRERIELAERYESTPELIARENKEKVDSLNEEVLDLGNEEAVLLEQSLKNIAKKYGREKELDKNLHDIEEQQTENFTESHKNMCEMFIEIYISENLSEDEIEDIEQFLEIVKFNNIDAEMKNKIDNLIQ